ncbi:HET domain-containing protein [Colletotrichum salicis]|uniref:HET domain-containing protein n=1 Tax=Colletotrichum salicis TaxID=1209931 RepID=A0A135TGB0_9PEZI|nr:HET domain-containing protein [Colletotrichum salicis]
MKLLNCSTLRIQEMHPARKQELEREVISTPYAILSRKWEREEDEVTFEDMGSAEVRSKKVLGWSKILQTCDEALERGIRYAWIDTCCIYKRNLTELTESVNSMYVDPEGDLAKSTWFTRGWTLQELIAPCKIEFYDKSWNIIGSRINLSREIQSLLASIPVGRRMSWAAGREAKKVEDRAYSLLEIFGVSMPLLYGEGDQAFIRLQEEIIKATNDMSLLAWCDSRVTFPEGSEELRGILTHTPDDFSNFCNLESISDPRRGPEFSMTNKGLRLETRIFTYGRGSLFLSLGCPKDAESKKNFLGILLHRLHSGIFVRASPDRLFLRDPFSNNRPLEKKFYFICKQFTPDLLEEPGQVPGRDFRICIAENSKIRVQNASPKRHWTPHTRTYCSRDFWDFEGRVEIGSSSEVTFSVTCGFDAQYGTWVYQERASPHWKPRGDGLQAGMPPGIDIEVVDGTEDGIPVTIINLSGPKSVAKKPAPKPRADPLPNSVEQADEERGIGVTEASGKRKPNCKKM